MLVDLRFAQLLCSRLCHDLIGPVGAINTGFELLEEEAGLPEDALGLVARSAREVSRRLAFYRVAFGLGGGSAVKPESVRNVLADFLVDTRVELDWIQDSDSEARLSVTGFKLILNLALLVRESLPRGGELTIRVKADTDGVAVTVRGAGKGAKLRDEVQAALTNEVAWEDLSARSAPAYLAVCLATELGTDVKVRKTEGDELAMTSLIPATAT